MADFPRKQVLDDYFFNTVDGLNNWHFVAAVDYSGVHDMLERIRHRKAVHDFIREDAEGRFFVDRTSRPGYWFENPRDAMLYKLRFL
ncbi:hypothetical protein D3C87_1030970 [compost metagenome]